MASHFARALRGTRWPAAAAVAASAAVPSTPLTRPAAPANCDVAPAPDTGTWRQHARITCFGEAMIRYIPDPEHSEGASQFTSRWLRGAGGAELNITVALSRLGWGGRAQWVSVVPSGVLGDDFMQLLSQAYPDGKGEDNLRLVRREEGDVGIYHVWPREHRLSYQRHHSIFALMDPAWFGEQFWTKTLSEPPSPGEPMPKVSVLHMTGITPQITSNTHKAWWKALKAARLLKEGGMPLVVTLDINHRPALGSWEDLWLMVEPHIGTLDLLVLSIGDLVNIGKQLNVSEAVSVASADIPKGLEEGARELDRCLQRGLKAVQQRLGHRTNLAVTCKLRDPSASTDGPPLQLRWSMVCPKNGEPISTMATHVLQRPVEEIGGGDSWLSGFIDGLVGLPEAAAEAPKWSEATWRAALQRGDMLAALKQQVVGDFSNVEASQLEEALTSHKVLGGTQVL